MKRSTIYATMMIISVGISLFLTSVVMFQSRTTVETPVKQTVVDNMTREKQDVYTPLYMVYTNEDTIQGTYQSRVYQQLLPLLKTIVIDDTKMSGTYSRESYDELVTANGIQFVFAAPVTIQMTKYLFEDVSQNVLSDEYHRLVISQRDNAVYLLNDTQLKGCRINLSSTDTFRKIDAIYKANRHYFTTMSILPLPKQLSYVFQDEVELNKETYLLERYSVLAYSKIAMGKHSEIHNISNSNEYYYTNEQTTLRVKKESGDLALSHKLFFDEEISFEDIAVQKWAEFEKWSMKSVYFGKKDRTYHFRRLIKGIPVFSKDNADELTLMHNERVTSIQLKASTLILQTELSKKRAVKSVLGANAVYTLLLQKPEWLAKIEGVTLGYHMVLDDTKRLMTIEPEWFVLIDGEWLLLEQG